MTKCQVVAVANRIPNREREPYYNYGAWIESLAKFGITPTVLGMDQYFKGLICIPRYMRMWLRSGACTAEYLIFSNAFDVLFIAHPDEVADRWLKMYDGNDVMFNCEKHLFPGTWLADRFPDTGSPWRYLNSGLYIGKPATILAMLEAMWLDEICDDYKAEDELHGKRQVNVVDQHWFHLMYAVQPVPITLDTDCHCFQSLSACSWDEFDISQPGKVVNKVTGATPLVLHCNGGAKNEMLPDLCRKFGCTP